MGKHTRKPPKDPYDPDKVGYRNPPKAHQFEKGKSGNTKGRPPGAKGIKTDLKAVLGTIRTISINGQDITGRTQWLMLEALALRGSYGDLRAIAQLLPLIIQVLGIEDRDVDANRMSPADEALLDRMLKRWTQQSDSVQGAAKPARKGKPAATGKRRRSGSSAPKAKPATSRRTKADPADG